MSQMLTNRILTFPIEEILEVSCAGVRPLRHRGARAAAVGADPTLQGPGNHINFHQRKN